MSRVPSPPKGLSAENPFPPDLACRFVWKKLLGSGGFGCVHLAEQVGLSRPVAVKILQEDILRDPDQVGRFVAEARITASISHENVIKVLDQGAEFGIPWIAYEFVPGRDLRTILAAGELTVPRAITAILQVLDALEAAHARGVLHRDIKPDNVLEVSRDRYKVTDFGIAKWTHSQAVKTRTGLILGTPAYLSPEQIQGEPPSPRSDVYATGAMLYELLTGSPPFKDENLMRILERHLKAEVPGVRDRCPEAPAPLDGVIQRAMAKDPRERYQTAREMRHALAPLLEAAPIPSPPRSLGVSVSATAPTIDIRASGRGEARRIPSVRVLVPIAFLVGLALSLGLKAPGDRRPISTPSPAPPGAALPGRAPRTAFVPASPDSPPPGDRALIEKCETLTRQAEVMFDLRKREEGVKLAWQVLTLAASRDPLPPRVAPPLWVLNALSVDLLGEYHRLTSNFHALTKRYYDPLEVIADRSGSSEAGRSVVFQINGIRRRSPEAFEELRVACQSCLDHTVLLLPHGFTRGYSRSLHLLLWTPEDYTDLYQAILGPEAPARLVSLTLAVAKRSFPWVLPAYQAILGQRTDHRVDRIRERLRHADAAVRLLAPPGRDARDPEAQFHWWCYLTVHASRQRALHDLGEYPAACRELEETLAAVSAGSLSLGEAVILMKGIRDRIRKECAK